MDPTQFQQLADQSLWFQAGMVGVFALFTLLLLQLEGRGREKSEGTWRTFLQGLNDSRDEDNKKWRELIELQAIQRREMTETAYKGYFDRIQEQSHAIEKLATAMAGHDSNSQVRQQQVLTALQELERVAGR